MRRRGKRTLASSLRSAFARNRCSTTNDPDLVQISLKRSDTGTQMQRAKELCGAGHETDFETTDSALVLWANGRPDGLIAGSCHANR